VRVARRVREGTCGRRPAATPAPRSQVYLTHDDIKRRGIQRGSELFGIATRALERLQRLPEAIRGFFRDPALAYIGM